MVHGAIHVLILTDCKLTPCVLSSATLNPHLYSDLFKVRVSSEIRRWLGKLRRVRLVELGMLRLEVEGLTRAWGCHLVRV